MELGVGDTGKSHCNARLIFLFYVYIVDVENLLLENSASTTGFPLPLK